MKRVCKGLSHGSDAVEAWMHRVPRAREPTTSSHDKVDVPRDFTATQEADLKENCRRLCCALRSVDCVQNAAFHYHYFSQQSRRLHFQNWVAYLRNCSPNVTAAERLTCPLLWCRESFEDIGKLLQHVSSCQCLSEGVYWCPDCQRPECFTKANASEDHQGTSPMKQVRNDIVKCAKKVATKLGSRSHRSSRSTASSTTSEERHPPMRGPCHMPLELQTNQYECLEEKQFVEMSSCEQTETQADSIWEASIDETPPATVDPSDLTVEPDTLSTFSVAELSNNCQYNEDNIPALPAETGVNSVYLEPMELDSHEVSFDESPLSWPPFNFGMASKGPQPPNMGMTSDIAPPVDFTSSTVWPVNARNSELVSPISSDSDFSSDTWRSSQSFRYPISPVNGVATSNTLSIASEPYQFEQPLLGDLAIPYDCSDVFRMEEPRSYPDQLVLQENGLGLSTPNQIPESLRPISMMQNAPSEQLLVEGVRDAFRSQYSRSTERICSSSVSPLASSFTNNRPASGALLNTGLLTLRKVILGVLPATSMEVFAILHLAYATACVLDCKSLLDQPEDVFADMASWKRTITDRKDRFLFEDLVQDLQALPSRRTSCQLLPSAQSDFTLSNGRESFDRPFDDSPKRESYPGALVDRRTFQNSDSGSSALPETENQQDDLLGILNDSPVIRVCLQYLDILEYAGFLENTCGDELRQGRYHPSTPNMSTFVGAVQQGIIEPLIKYPRLEGFIQDVVNTEKSVICGALQNVREVELKLLYDGMHTSKSKDLYNLFKKAISRLCNEVSYGLGSTPSFRAIQYSRNIDKTIRMLSRLDQDQQPPSATSQPLYPYPCSGGLLPGSKLLRSTSPFASQGLRINTCVDMEITSSSNASSAHTSPSDYFNGANFASPPHISSQPLVRNTSSPESGSVPQFSQTPAPTQDSTAGFLECHLCGARFQGQHKWRKSNLRRHTRTVHPQKRQKLKCSDKTCGKTFSRSDNLRHHQRLYHAGVSGSS